MAGENENKNKSDISSNKQDDEQLHHLPSPSSPRFFFLFSLIFTYFPLILFSF
jgi:hypothetical protein